MVKLFVSLFLKTEIILNLPLIFQVPHLCRSDGASESGNDFGSGLVLGTRIAGAAAGPKSKSDRFHVVHLAPTPDSNDDEDSSPGW